MAALLPIIKIVLPYLAPIFKEALPVFTKKKSEKVDPVVVQQINELQDAVKANSESTKALAKAIEEAAEFNDGVIKRTRIIAVLALVLAFLALAIAVASLSK